MLEVQKKLLESVETGDNVNHKGAHLVQMLQIIDIQNELSALPSDAEYGCCKPSKQSTETFTSQISQTTPDKVRSRRSRARNLLPQQKALKPSNEGEPGFPAVGDSPSPICWVLKGQG